MTGARPALAVLWRIAVPLCILLFAGSVGAQAYKWKDAGGRTHFSDTPPADSKAEKITVKPQMPEDPSAAARSRDWRAQIEASNMQRLEAQKQADAAERQARTDEEKCRTARASLDTYQRGGRVYRYNKHGQREYVEDKDRPAALQAALDRVNRFCR